MVHVAPAVGNKCHFERIWIELALRVVFDDLLWWLIVPPFQIPNITFKQHHKLYKKKTQLKELNATSEQCQLGIYKFERHLMPLRLISYSNYFLRFPRMISKHGRKIAIPIHKLHSNLYISIFPESINFVVNVMSFDNYEQEQ